LQALEFAELITSMEVFTKNAEANYKKKLLNATTIEEMVDI